MTQSEGLAAWLRLTLIPGLGGETQRKLLAAFGLPEAVFAAATEQGSKVRYPAGADTKLVSDLRWTTSEDHYLEKMRKMFSPRVAS